MLFLQALACAAELSSNECDTGKREFEFLQLIFNIDCLLKFLKIICLMLVEFLLYIKFNC